MERSPQISATLDKELYKEVEEMAVKESRSISSMVSVLLRQAVNQRLRKRKDAKEDNKV